MAKWQKGESGNPGGRPKGLGDIREIARKHTDTAIETLVSVLGDPNANASARVNAANALLDRGWGRPAQTLHATIDSEERNRAVDTALSDSARDLLQKIRKPENTRASGEEGSAPAAQTTPSTH